MDIVTWFSLLGGCVFVFFICLIVHTVIKGAIKKLREARAEKDCGQDAEDVAGIITADTMVYIRLWSPFFTPYKKLSDGYIGYVYYVPESPHTRRRIVSYTVRQDKGGTDVLYAVFSDMKLITVDALKDYYCNQEGRILGIAHDGIE